MMRIRITAVTSIADGRGNRYTSGQVADVDEGLARAWIAAGHAIEAQAPGGVEATGQDRPPRKRTGTRRAPRRGTTSD